jgi:hypothetical protein
MDINFPTYLDGLISNSFSSAVFVYNTIFTSFVVESYKWCSLPVKSVINLIVLHGDDEFPHYFSSFT